MILCACAESRRPSTRTPRAASGAEAAEDEGHLDPFMAALSEAGRVRAQCAHAEANAARAPRDGGVVRPPLDEALAGRISASPEHVLATGDVPLFSYYKQVS